MECPEIRESLLAKASGRLSPEEVTAFDRHVGACDSCAARVKASTKALALLNAYRIATDLDPGDDEVAEVLALVSSQDTDRAERARQARETSGGNNTRLYVYAAVAVLVLAAAGFVLKETLFGTAPPSPNPIVALLDQVTDDRQARDFALLLDIQLQEEWARLDVRHRRIAALVLARRLARRCDQPDGIGFLKAVLQEHAETVMERGGSVVYAAETVDPLAAAGELEQAWQFERVAAECDRVLSGGVDDEVRTRASLHKAVALALAGRIDEARALVDPLLPAVEAPPEPAEGEPPPEEIMPAMPEEFLGRVAWHVADRLRRARAARVALGTHQRPKPDESDYRGGELGFRAFDADASIAFLTGAEEPILVGLVSRAWAELMRGNLDAARVPLNDCFQRAQKRFTRSIAQLGLAEIAFLEGRFYSGIGHLGLAREHAPDSDGPNKYVALIILHQAMRELLDEGSTPRANISLKDLREELETHGGALLAKVEEVLAPLAGPMAKKRDDVTSKWPEDEKSPFSKVFERIPGEVRGRSLRTAGFNNGVEGAVGRDGSSVSLTDGMLGQALGVASSRGVAAARFALGEPEVETWAIFAVRAEDRGSFSICAADDAGTEFCWRTHVLKPGRWYRLAVPLGALAPSQPAAGRQTLLGATIAHIEFAFDAGESRGARFAIDDLMLYAGQGFGQNVDTAPASE